MNENNKILNKTHTQRLEWIVFCKTLCNSCVRVELNLMKTEHNHDSFVLFLNKCTGSIERVRWWCENSWTSHFYLNFNTKMCLSVKICISSIRMLSCGRSTQTLIHSNSITRFTFSFGVSFSKQNDFMLVDVCALPFCVCFWVRFEGKLLLWCLSVPSSHQRPHFRDRSTKASEA